MQEQPRYLYLYPSGDQFNQLTFNGDSSNYMCVDETWNDPDDATTYVSTDSIGVVSDVYTTQDHTTQTGSISWVEIHSRAKAESSPSPTYTYKLLCNVSGTTAESSNQNLLNNWNEYSTLHGSSPSDSSDWSWSDIDIMQIGVACSSPSNVASTEKTLTLYPNISVVTYQTGGNPPSCVKYGTPCATCGDGSEWHHYLMESPWDQENRIQAEPVTCGASIVTATIGFDSHSVDETAFNITKVVFFYVSASYTDAASHIVYFSLNNDPTQTQWSRTHTHTSWTLSSKEFTSQPSDSSSWTWSAVNDIEIGFRLEATATYGSGFANAYIVVYYTGENMWSPDIMTTQCYAKVKYKPANERFYLNKPTSIRKLTSRDTKATEFWNERREVYDINIAQAGLELNGFETGSTGESRLNDIMDVIEYESGVTLTGLNEDRYDGGYFIQDFNYTMGASAPTTYYWNMILEKA